MITSRNRYLVLSMVLSAVVAAAGCATTGDVERVQGEAAGARKLAQDAKAAADQASSTANSAASEARAAAQRSADEGKAAAQEAKRAADEAKAATQALDEKLERAFKKSQKK
jgi:hypothetical protein